MVNMNRRTFLDVAGTGMLAGLSTQLASAAPSERIRHALIGTGGQCKRHAQGFSGFEDCDVVAICDVDPVRRKAFSDRLPNPDKLAVYDDYRKIIDDPEIDSVSIVTPDHWHTPIALAALKAGKHVYVEKPCSHNIAEAQLLLKAAEKTGKCVQHGTQGRAAKALQEAVAFMRDGGIGKVRMAKAINHQHRPPIGREPKGNPPEGVNYDMWLGPAPLHGFTNNRWHYNWHWFWDYGSGDIGNDGIHQVDQARWGLGVTVPNAVVASGGQFYYDDDHETPDTQTVIYEYDDCQLVFEMRLWTNYKLEGHDNGVVFYGDKGKVEFGREGAKAFFLDGQEKVFGAYADIRDHFRNFLDCIKANDPSGLNSHIREGALSTTLCHLGNIATRVQQRLQINPETWECTNSPEATALYKREYRKGYELPVVS